MNERIINKVITLQALNSNTLSKIKTAIDTVSCFVQLYGPAEEAREQVLVQSSSIGCQISKSKLCSIPIRQGVETILMT